MLAIYASEKALRLAEALGEARAASRAHGIFGRVFGRIGDAAKARENLERAVALARESDAAETVLALQALGHNLEHTEGDHEGARARYERGAVAGRADRRRAGPDRAAGRARPARASTAASGRRPSVRPRPAPSWPNARGSSASCAWPNVLRGRLRLHEGDLERLAAAVRVGRRAGRAGRLVGGRGRGADGPGHRAASRPGTTAGGARRAARGAQGLRARRAAAAVGPGERQARRRSACGRATPTPPAKPRRAPSRTPSACTIPAAVAAAAEAEAVLAEPGDRPELRAFEARERSETAT